MAQLILNEAQLAILRRGVNYWNTWRKEHPEVAIDLHEVDLRNANLNGVNLAGARLYGANFYHADLGQSNLQKAWLPHAFMDGTDLRSSDLRHATLVDATLTTADLQDADLSGATLNNAKLHLARLRRAKLAGTHLQSAQLFSVDFELANLTEADLLGADLTNAHLIKANLGKARLNGANLTDADLTDANLEDADLSRAIFVRTKIQNAILTGAKIYGLSAWDLQGTPQQAGSLVITPHDQSPVTVDDLAIAQFTYLLLNNERIRDVINTIARKAVLILGRFTERKEVLDSLKTELRKRGYLPIVFDFERPTDRDFTETVMTLAGMCLFIIAEITKPKSVPLELQATVPNYMIPFVPIIEEGEQPFAMFADIWNKHRDWVIDPLYYDSIPNLVRVFDKAVIDPAIERHDAIQARKAEALITRHVKDYSP